MLKICTGGTPTGSAQVSPPVTLVTLALAFATRRPVELKQMEATPLLLI